MKRLVAFLLIVMLILICFSFVIANDRCVDMCDGSCFMTITIDRTVWYGKSDVTVTSTYVQEDNYYLCYGEQWLNDLHCNIVNCSDEFG